MCGMEKVKDIKETALVATTRVAHKKLPATGFDVGVC